MKKTLNILCTTLAIMLLSGCGGETPHEHTFSTEWEKNETNHWHKATCEHTDLVSGLSGHNYGNDNICDDCGYVKEIPTPAHEHTFDEEYWEMNETSHWHKATCGHDELTKDLAAHNYGGDNICDDCGYTKPTPAHEHTFDTEWSKDETNHWHASTCEHTGLTIELSAHDYGEDNVCDVCGYVKPIPEQPHEHTFKTEFVYDETNHWHEASCEHTDLISGLEVHNFGDDNICDSCGYEKPAPIVPHEHTFNTEYTFDESNHWHEATCEHTDLFSGLSAHNFGDDDVCDDCGYTKPAPAHEHSFSDVWSKDATSHWHEATCEHTDLTKDLASHEYGDDNICDVCGYELIVKEQYIVYFATNGGSNVQPELVEHGEKASMPEDPTKENYVFLGWYKSQEYTGIAYDFEEEITENTTLYALWGAKISYVNYDGETYKEENVRLNTKIEAPEDPSWSEAHFLGWYESSNFEGTTFDFDLGANKNTTLYARYGYALEFIGVNNKTIASLIQPADQILSDPGETSIDYYDFDNYYTDPEYTQLFEFGNKLTKDTKIYLNFIPKTYNISYSFTDGITHTNPTSYVYGVGVETILDPTSFAYSDTKQFCGWYFDDNFTQPATSISKEMHGDITLYAKVVKVVNITYNGWPKTITNPNPTKVIAGEAFSLDISPLEEIEGISNVKFMVCGEELTSKFLQIDEDMTIDVVFDSQETTITFDPNGGVFLPKNAFIYIDGPKLAGGKRKVDVTTNNGRFNLFDYDIMEEMLSVQGTDAIFEGFYFDSEFKNPLTTSSMNINKIGNGSTIYAKFEETPNENIPYETYGNWSDLSGNDKYRTFIYDLEVPKGVKKINISYEVNATSGTHQLWLYDYMCHERDPINEWHGVGKFEVNESIDVEGKTELRLQYEYSGDQLSFYTYSLSVDPEVYDKCFVQCVSSSTPITSECNYYHVPEIPYTGLEREYYTFDGWVDSNNNKVDLTSDWLINEEEATLKASWIGHKLVYGKQTPDGTAYDFVVTSPGEQAPYSSSLLLDFSEVSSNDIYLLSYDNSSDAFITLLKQWGSNAVEVSQSDLIKDLRRRKGHIVFNFEINRQKTIECLTFFEKLNTEKLFGLPINFSSSFVLDAFTKNETMFTIITSSSASFFSNDSNKRVRFAPIPYFDDGVEIRKFAAFNETGVLTFNNSNQENAVEIAKSLTSGENQARWCIDTGYIPTTKSATFSPNYQNFINGSNYDDLTSVYKRESNQVYQNTYMNLSNNWTLYVNDIFMSYLNVYDEFGSILEKVFSYGKTEEKIHQILQDTLKEYNSITDVVID